MLYGDICVVWWHLCGVVTPVWCVDTSVVWWHLCDCVCGVWMLPVTVVPDHTDVLLWQRTPIDLCDITVFTQFMLTYWDTSQVVLPWCGRGSVNTDPAWRNVHLWCGIYDIANISGFDGAGHLYETVEQLYSCFSNIDKFISCVKCCCVLHIKKCTLTCHLCVHLWCQMPMYLGNCFMQEMGMLVNSLRNGFMILHVLFVEYCQLVFWLECYNITAMPEAELELGLCCRLIKCC